MLPDLDGLLDEHVKVLWNIGGQAVGLEDAEDLLTGDGGDLGDSTVVTEGDADLGRGHSLLGEPADLLLNISGGDLLPRRRGALVRLGTLGDALSGCVHTSHICFLLLFGRGRG